MNGFARLPPRAERLDRHQAAELLGVSPRTLRNYELAGYKGIRLVPYRVGGKLWYSKELLETWVLETERARQARDEAVIVGGEREHRAALERLRAMGVDV
jgi:hypothetical protein